MLSYVKVRQSGLAITDFDAACPKSVFHARVRVCLGLVNQMNDCSQQNCEFFRDILDRETTASRDKIRCPLRCGDGGTLSSGQSRVLNPVGRSNSSGPDWPTPVSYQAFEGS